MSTELPSSTGEDAAPETLFSAPEPVGEESDTESVRSALEQNDALGGEESDTESVRSALEQNDALGGDEDGTLTDDDALTDDRAVTTGDSASQTLDTGAIIREE